MDRRFLAYNDRVAAVDLRPSLQHHNFVEPKLYQVCVAITDLRKTPNGARQRQLTYGSAVELLEDFNGWSFIRHKRDGYVGYIPSQHLGPFCEATHIVVQPWTHCYEAADIKSNENLGLPLSSKVSAFEVHEGFVRTDTGWIPQQHVVGIDASLSDPIVIAEKFIGSPYLWGGNSIIGIDCSGLIQTSLFLCGIEAPADSDMQRMHLGQFVEDEYQRGDLLFWEGHVAFMYNNTHILHANAHSMSVSIEPLDSAQSRISRLGGGEILAHKRLKG